MDLDPPHDIAIELQQLFGGYPKLFVLRSADGPHFETAHVLCVDVELRHEPAAGLLRIPVARNLRCVFFIEDRIENRLFRDRPVDIA